jgi:hypothetical protein
MTYITGEDTAFAQPGRSVPDRGIDLAPEARPGVPMERSPQPVTGSRPGKIVPQEPRAEVLKRMELDHLTPVFGTAQPPRGLSGVMRRLAYQAPEHKARRWMTLLLADRVDVMENRLIRNARWIALALPALALAGLFVRDRRPMRRWSFAG